MKDPVQPYEGVILGFKALGEFIGVPGDKLRKMRHQGVLPIRTFGRVGSVLAFAKEDAARYKVACESGLKRLRKNRKGFGRQAFQADFTAADAIEMLNPFSGVVAGDLPTQDEQVVLDALDKVAWDLSDAWNDYMRPQERSIDAAQRILSLAGQIEGYTVRLRGLAEPVVIAAQREIDEGVQDLERN